MNTNQYVQPLLKTNALLNNYNDTKEDNIKSIIDNAFNDSPKKFIIIIGNVIADILNKDDIENYVSIIRYIIEKIDNNPPMEVEKKDIILNIIRRLNLRSDDLSKDLIVEIRNKYIGEDDIQKYLNNSNLKSNNLNSTNSSKSINKDDFFQNNVDNNLIIRIIGFFNYEGVKKVLSLDAKNEFCMTDYNLFLTYFTKINSCSINLNINDENISDFIIEYNSLYRISFSNKYFILFDDSNLEQNWTL